MAPLLAVVLAVASQASERAPFSVPLAAVEGVPGQVLALEGVTDPTGQAFDFPALALFQPVILSIVSDDPHARLAVEVYGKEDPQGEPSRRETVGPDGLQMRFRTGGEFRLVLESLEGAAPYGLALWVGDEMKRGLPTVLTPAEDYEEAAQDSPAPTQPSPLPTWFLLVLACFMAVIAYTLIVRARRGASG
jgi:hypothetical protein